MPVSRRLLLLVPAVALVGSCTRPGSKASPGPSGSSSSWPGSSLTPSASATPRPLTDKGHARSAVNQLRRASGELPVLKVDLTATRAVLSVLDGSKVKSWAWEAATVQEVTSDIEYIKQATFDPSSFQFDDLTMIFGIAGALSGSTSNQELQIVEYNPGQVLMVVSTRPESRPVFFRPDASPIHELDYRSKQGIAEGLQDALGGRTQLHQLGYQKGMGLWVDAPDPNDPGVMVRRTRASKLPVWTSSKKETSDWPMFAASDVTADILATIIADLPARYDKPVDADISYTIDMRDRRSLPAIRWVVGGQAVITDLEGVDITAEVNR
ncbi:hypothetical protein [Aestuariimicrobium kwangyangense]|uniref:hypothetical protein n=1 Tax=Aestuariimicrobium kwangyangense TaxID=396389 RepID=UPI0003B63602|nr:hypothetical protein [Aestuariimicrobium kwangyangense]